MVKLYFDSRARAAGTNESPVFSIVPSIDLSRPHIALIDSVCIPNTFPSIASNAIRLFVQELLVQAVPVGSTIDSLRVVELKAGNYSAVSLAAEVARALSANSILTDPYTCAFDPVANRLVVSNALSGPAGSWFAIWPEEYMENSIHFWNAQSQTQLNKEDLRSANRTCGFLGSNLVTSYASSTQTDLTADSAPNLIQYHNLFIHSPDLALGDQVRGPKNQLTIVRRVVMQAPKDEINVDKHGTAFDTVRVGIGS